MNKPLTPQPIGLISKQNWLRRVPRFLWLLATTNYKVRVAWHQAAR
ncbi:hypothetical protein Q9292_10000 [Methylophilus sp. VKM B-3414]|nr:hypothetical protein [Methylophilus sp. VKM B-3414]MDT7849943.1 hypothetical protein [Methylophilus sp. VKM B-3414]